MSAQALIYLGGEFAPSYEITGGVDELPNVGDLIFFREGADANTKERKNIVLKARERVFIYSNDAGRLTLERVEIRALTIDEERRAAMAQKLAYLERVNKGRRKKLTLADVFIDPEGDGVDEYERTGEQDEERARLDQQAADYDANPPNAVDMSDATRQAVDEVREAGAELRRQGYL